ncbi:hypothetical protein HU200_043551 [Digitaria exilis]|uniref:Uncharacterized protein n=1 Tax=Digitaria exilis TaxID=1010633 RepID=A0A835EDU1_9POAL|nr:hypothetical protein HU200_043551 [Digitaria exilis]
MNANPPPADVWPNPDASVKQKGHGVQGQSRKFCPVTRARPHPAPYLSLCAHCAGALGKGAGDSTCSLGFAGYLRQLPIPTRSGPSAADAGGRGPPAMGNCCSDEVGHGGAHPAAQAASAAADRFLRSRNAGASTQIEVRSPPRAPPSAGRWFSARAQALGHRHCARRSSVATDRSRCAEYAWG